MSINVAMETLAYPCFLLRHHIRPGAGGRVPVSTAAMDCVFATYTTGHITQLSYNVYVNINDPVKFKADRWILHFSVLTPHCQ